MIIAIDGTQYITKELANELIIDWITDKTELIFMAQDQDTDPDGLCNAWETVEDLELEERALIELYDSFNEFSSRTGDKVFFCLGVAGIEDEVNACIDQGIPVLDLCRALYPITERIDNGSDNNEE